MLKQSIFNIPLLLGFHDISSIELCVRALHVQLAISSASAANECSQKCRCYQAKKWLGSQPVQGVSMIINGALRHAAIVKGE